jgi:hypothetical protein
MLARRRRAVRCHTLGEAFDAATRARPMMQVLLAELVIAQLSAPDLRDIFALAANGQTAPSLLQMEQLHCSV